MRMHKESPQDRQTLESAGRMRAALFKGMQKEGSIIVAMLRKLGTTRMLLGF